MKEKPSAGIKRCLLPGLLICLFSTAAFSQTFTPKYNTSMTVHSKGYYEYLPTGYSAGSQKYPLLVFFHGLGELGDGSSSNLSKVLANGTPKQINQGIFPATFNVDGKTFSFIVLCPQFVDWPESYDVENIINYAIKNYRVDTSRIYLTGLSMGGGVVWTYAGDGVNYSRRISAMVPISGAAYPTDDRCMNIAAGNVPAWATHNDGDPTVPVSNTIGFVTGINKTRIPPNPRAKMSIFSSGSHDAWSHTYDLNFKEDGLNVYEWMLQFQKVSVLPVLNLKFSGKQMNSDALLTWNTTGESNNEGFSVERSADGAHFDSLAFIPTIGENGGNYQYTDAAPLNGRNFYRLKVIAVTGQVTNSNVISIDLAGSNKVSIFPNPVGNIMNLQTNYDPGKAVLRIFDMSGKTVFEKALTGTGNHSIPLNLPAGMYSAVLIESGNIAFKQSFIKR